MPKGKSNRVKVSIGFMRRDTNFHKTYKSQCVDVIPPGKSIDAKVLQLMLFPTDTFRIREKKWN